VFNFILASVFWGLMADVFSNEQGRRLFGAIAAGGTAGAFSGPLMTRALVHLVGVEGMLLVTAGFVGLALACVAGVARGGRAREETGGFPPDSIIGGRVLAGLTNVARSPYLLTLCATVVLLSTTATVLYFQQLWIVEREISDRADRTAFFAVVDFWAQSITLVTQLLLTRWLVRRVGVTGLLVAVPLVIGVSFVLLAIAPVLASFAIAQVLRRAGESGLGRPAREILFTVVPREDKFKAKNVVDVVVYRGSDAAMSWLTIALVGVGARAMALAALPLCALWIVISVALGRMEERRRLAAHAHVEEGSA
jgi:AAA family ATP:ADP antiporter